MDQPPSDDIPPVEPPAPERGGGLHLLAAWLLILLVVAGIVAMTQAMRAGSEAAAEESAQPVAPAAMDPQLLAAKTAVGLRALDQAVAQEPDQVLAEQDQLAGDEPVKQWRSAVIAGELLDAEAARGRLGGMIVGGEGEVALDVAVLYQIYLEGADAVAREQVLRLRQRHGWFAHLALSHGAADDDPQRRAVLSAATRTAVVLAVASMGVIALLAGGVACSILAFQRWRRGSLAPAYRADRAAGPVYASGFALYLLAFVGFSLVASLVLGLLGPGSGIEPLVHWAFVPLLAVLLVLWLRLFRVPRAEAVAAIGLHRGAGWLREIGAGLLGYLAGVPLVVLGFLIATQLEGGPGAEHPVMDQIAGGGPLAVVGAFLLAAVFAPLVEETTFRGLLYHHLRTWYGPPLAALIQGLLFAVVHPQGVAAVPILAALGIVFALIREWRGSLVAPMAAHALHNATALTVVLLLMG